jgi:membrane protein YqaA with SNARE-associated domain
MKRLTAWIEAYAVAWGGPGLFVIGFLDSSFLSFPEVNDLLIIGMVMKHHGLLVWCSAA